MGYNLLINGVYWGYNPVTNHLLTSWNIQVGYTPTGNGPIRWRWIFFGAKIFGECSALRIYTITYQHQVIGMEIHFIQYLVSCYIGIYK